MEEVSNNEDILLNIVILASQLPSVETDSASNLVSLRFIYDESISNEGGIQKVDDYNNELYISENDEEELQQSTAEDFKEGISIDIDLDLETNIDTEDSVKKEIEYLGKNI
ncbi:hypothetical protein L873DRAFT_1791974 [Choiromyces venosus 120613-1]|uniref:Uncharacterized protein n=1 Tax=Choiromyces venosus 120613-1 TaxID=1336337 RepID=A0A3N4JC81_9PEZI|nr:hypothetical protein L873DRAFT_1791974 [Choiromyces venosus 120613-1]